MLQRQMPPAIGPLFCSTRLQAPASSPCFMRVDIITIFPGYFGDPFDYGIVRRARAAGLIEINAHDLRTWTADKHRVVDDRPFGGGDGMVLKPEPIFAAVQALTGATSRDG